ncbi:MAG: hypothetical protein L6Q71_05255 [Planctomycetes bacterium]|nr:hypothetical protein [Planctomycetota bacterium]NUQ34434.1 hypothetical protein [Planctomycetaceae bacterium]
MRIPTVLLAAAAAALPFLSLCPASAAGGQGPKISYDEALKRYDESLGHPDFYHRARGIQTFANCADERAFNTLIERYFKPDDPNPHPIAYKNLIAGCCGTAFADQKHVDEWQGWMGRAATAFDSWLHYFGRSEMATYGKADEVLAFIRDVKNDVFLRAAAIEGLGAAKYSGIAEFVAQLLDDKKMFGKGLDRSVLVESCANVMLPFKGKNDTPVIAALNALADQIDERANLERSKLVIARRLARILESPELYFDAKSWKPLIEGLAAKTSKSGSKKYREPHFMGVSGSGKKTAFIIDLSDSMLKELTTDEIEDIKDRVVTGKKEKEKENAKKKKDTKNDPGEDLPWDQIKNRFDAAREALIQSLKNLEPDMEFTVVTFGTDVRWLNSTNGLVPATSVNVNKAVSELKGIKPSGKRLRGNTNIHGGFLRAFRSLKNATHKGEDEHVAARGFEEGCDSIFLLTDGAATCDDYTEKGILQKTDGHWKDPETGEEHHGPPGETQIPWKGPYRIAHLYVQDILRMNLFRKSEINCIGIGEADFDSLKEIAEAGLGTFVSIGKDTSEDKDDDGDGRR